MLSRSYYSLPLQSLITASTMTGGKWIIPPENQGVEERMPIRSQLAWL